MGISTQVEKVYQRALDLRQRAIESPVQPDLLDQALRQLYFVLEELQVTEEELRQQNQALTATRHTIEIERQRYKTLFDLAPDGYLVTDRQGLIHQANRAAAVLCGVPQAYLEQKPLLVFIDQADLAAFQVWLATPTWVQDWPVNLRRRGADPLPVAVSVGVLKNSQGQDDAFLWLLRDMTQRQQMEQALQAAHDDLEQQVRARTAELSQSNQQLQQEIDHHRRANQKIREQAALIDLVPDAIYVENRQGVIEFWNQGAVQLYGYAEAEALGQNATTLLMGAGNPLPQQVSSGFWQGEIEHQTHGGDRLILRSRQIQIDDGAGERRLVVNTDITGAKQLEAQVDRAQRIDSLGTMASSIAHDLNNVLTPVAAAADMLLHTSQPVHPSDQELLGLIKTGTQHCVDLLRRLLLFDRSSDRSSSDNRILLSLRESILEVLTLLQQTTTPAIQLCSSLPAACLGWVLANPTQLHQILINLCLNGCDAMPQGGTLTLTLGDRYVAAQEAQRYVSARPGNYVVVTVVDTGAGIDPAILDRIFDPFFTTKSPGQGTGLGLSTVFSLVSSHGGFLQVNSQLGQGTEMKVYLPAADPPDP
ncbi:MAG: PAS domain-containing sensor histidine kinase [Nodosilinea sp.]